MQCLLIKISMTLWRWNNGNFFQTYLELLNEDWRLTVPTLSVSTNCNVLQKLGSIIWLESGLRNTLGRHKVPTTVGILKSSQISFPAPTMRSEMQKDVLGQPLLGIWIFKSCVIISMLYRHKEQEHGITIQLNTYILVSHKPYFFNHLIC